MGLDLTNLRKALGQLETATKKINMAKEKPLDNETIELMRDGVIQRFEYTYELCWKYIQRWIRENRTPEEADNFRTRKELFRLAARYGLIEGPLPWFDYGNARNITSHIYNVEQAERAYEIAVKFVADAQYLLKKLEKAND